MLTIVESNPHIFIQRFVEAVSKQYYLENSNRGWIVDLSLKELNMYKQRDQPVYENMQYGEVIISDYDTQCFLEKLQGAVIQKGDVDVNSLYWDMAGVKSVKVILSAPYTKEELDDMDWEDLKEVCKKQGVSGRDRSVIINKYLKVVSGED